MRLFLSLYLLVSVTSSLLILSALACSAQQPFTILKRFNQHTYEDRLFGIRDNFLDIKNGTNFFNKYENVKSSGLWPQSLSNAYVTNYYIWSFINSSGQFVVTESVQWFNVPNSLNLMLINQPLPPGVTPRFPYPHIGTNAESTVYTTLEDMGQSQLLIARGNNPVPGLNFSKKWYYRLNCYTGSPSIEYHTGVALFAGGTAILCIDQAELMDSSNILFGDENGWWNGAYDQSPVEYNEFNTSHTIAFGTTYSAPAIPSRHSITENYIPGFFNQR